MVSARSPTMRQQVSVVAQRRDEVGNRFAQPLVGGNRRRLGEEGEPRGALAARCGAAPRSRARASAGSSARRSVSVSV